MFDPHREILEEEENPFATEEEFVVNVGLSESQQRDIAVNSHDLVGLPSTEFVQHNQKDNAQENQDVNVTPRIDKRTRNHLTQLRISSDTNKTEEETNSTSPLINNIVTNDEAEHLLQEESPVEPVFSPGVYYAPASNWQERLKDQFNAARQNPLSMIPDETEDASGKTLPYSNFMTIDWQHDTHKDRLRLKALRSRLGMRGQMAIMLDAVQGWILVFLVGGITGILAALIAVSADWATDLKEGFCTSGFYLKKSFCCAGTTDECPQWVEWPVQGVAYVGWSVLFAVIAAMLVKRFAPYSAGSGIPEVKTILGGFIIRKFLGGWTLVIKCVGLVLSVASGLNVGKEGPLVHVGCCVGNILPRMFIKYRCNEAKRREILSAAAAAGVSVAFGAPIGGILFSLEEVSYYFPYKVMWRSFFCAMVAALSLQIMNPFRTGKLVLFQVTYDRDWHAFELPFFMLLGVLGGIYGASFIRLNLNVAARRKSMAKWRTHPIIEVALVTFVTALISFPFGFLKLGTVEFLAALFRECTASEPDFHGLCDRSRTGEIILLLLAAAAIKYVLTIFTFGIRVPAGIFIPSMAIGACLGRVLGLIIQAWYRAYPSFALFAPCHNATDCITPGTYALVGAAAALSGLTRMTVSLTVIMFELTGALTYVVPIMSGVMCAKWVGDAFGKESIYDGLIQLNGYPFLDAKERYHGNASAAAIMTSGSDLQVVSSSDSTVGELEEMLQTTEYKGFPVVNSARDMLLIGWIGRNELKYALDKAKRESGVPDNTICYFAGPLKDANALMDPLITNDAGDGSPFNLPTASPRLSLKSWVDQTPMTVTPKFPVDMVLEMFKKLGLRFVLVTTQGGQLLGLITKKDLLNHLHEVKRRTNADSRNGLRNRRRPIDFQNSYSRLVG